MNETNNILTKLLKDVEIKSIKYLSKNPLKVKILTESNIYIGYQIDDYWIIKFENGDMIHNNWSEKSIQSTVKMLEIFFDRKGFQLLRSYITEFGDYNLKEFIYKDEIYYVETKKPIKNNIIGKIITPKGKAFIIYKDKDGLIIK